MKQLVKGVLDGWITRAAELFVRRMRLDELLSASVAHHVMLSGRLGPRANNQPLHVLFGDLSDECWLWANTKGYRANSELRAILPGMPDEQLQTFYTGHAGDSTLAEGFAAYRVFKPLFEKHVGEFGPSRKVLDFGCGWGRVIRFFLKDIDPANLWGIDCQEEVLAAARATNPWCQFRLVAPRPPADLPPDSFDMIYCFSVFSHLSEDAHAGWLAEFHRLLKPGGLLVATTRPREFIATIDAHLKTLPAWWPRPKEVFPDAPGTLARYDAGEYCYSGVGGHGVLNKSFFGETCIPRGYVLKHWTKRFQFLEFIEDRQVCPQNVIAVRK